jgi:hypothetical protein
MTYDLIMKALVASIVAGCFISVALETWRDDQ